MKRVLPSLAICAGALAFGPTTAATAAPPAAPPGCQQVLETPAITTGAPQGIAGKIAAYERVCGVDIE